jgi:hypothetical protein
MSVPAPVNDGGYSFALSDDRSTVNHIGGGTVFGASYDDNVLASSSNAIATSGYYVSPWISLSQSSTRSQWSVEYNPRFTAYERVSSLDRTDQALDAKYLYRITPYASIRFQDSFTKSSNLLDQIGDGGPLADVNLLQYTSGSIVAALADVLINRASVEAEYQFGQNDMVGGEFSHLDVRYPIRSQAIELYDSTSLSGEGYYAHRISSTDYVGALLRDGSLSAFPNGSDTHVQGILFFYSATLFHGMSLSVAAGPEHSTTYLQPYGWTTDPVRTWLPAIAAGLRWQGSRAGLAANFTKRIQGGGGLFGAVRATSIEISTRYQLSRLMSVQIAAAYSNSTVFDWNTAATSGYGLLASASLERQLGERFTLRIGYGTQEQRHSWVPGNSGILTRNQGSISLSYRFDRPPATE